MSSTIKAVRGAPLVLLTKYQSRDRFSGRDILGRLLAEPSMTKAWEELGKHVKRDAEWERFFSDIISIVRRARKAKNAPTAKELSDEFRNVSEAASRLRRSFEPSSLPGSAKDIVNRKLDLMAYEFFPEDVASMLWGSAWLDADGPARASAAEKSMVSPTFIEMLQVFEARADALARSAAESPQRKTRRRDVATPEKKAFVEALIRYSRERSWSLSTATITAVASAGLGYEISYRYIDVMNRRVT